MGSSCRLRIPRFSSILEDMENRISIITLGISDLKRSVTFYRDGLGLPTNY